MLHNMPQRRQKTYTDIKLSVTFVVNNITCYKVYAQALKCGRYRQKINYVYGHMDNENLLRLRATLRLSER